MPYSSCLAGMYRGTAFTACHARPSIHGQTLAGRARFNNVSGQYNLCAADRTSKPGLGHRIRRTKQHLKAI